MNIIYILGDAATFDKSQFIRRGTKIDIEFHKIENFAEGSAIDNVVTIRGFAAYYKRCFSINLHCKQIMKLADCSCESDAVNLWKYTALLRKYDVDQTRTLS